MFDERNWILANPGLDVICSREHLRADVEQAARLPSAASSTRNFYFNQREHGEAPFMSRDVWQLNDQPSRLEVFRSRPVAVGIDLSTRQDLSAIVLAAMDDEGVIHLEPHCWLPEDTVMEHIRTDRAPYDVWIKHGWVHTTRGNEVDYETLARFLNERTMVYDIAHGYADRWRLDDLKRQLRALNVEIPIEAFDQGFKGMSPAIEQVEILAGQGRLAHGGHPVLQWCVANATTTPNTSGFRRFAKIERYGRIDLAVAMTMAVYACCSTAMIDASAMIG